MAEYTYDTFPWQGFALWLKEGILAATIVNKLMNASWSESQRSEKQPLDVQPEELVLLRQMRRRVSREYRESIDDTLRKLDDASTYPELSEDQIHQLWEALTTYCTMSNRFDSIKDGLKLFLQDAPSDPDAFVLTLAEHIWGSLGPALAQDERMLTHG